MITCILVLGLLWLGGRTSSRGYKAYGGAALGGALGLALIMLLSLW